jgi:hypothetical protein
VQLSGPVFPSSVQSRVKSRIVHPLDRDWREEGAAMAVVRRVMVVRRDGKCIMMVGYFLMLYAGSRASLGVELEQVVRWDSKKRKGSRYLYFPHQLSLSSSSPIHDYDQKLNHANQSLICSLHRI